MKKIKLKTIVIPGTILVLTGFVLALLPKDSNNPDNLYSGNVFRAKRDNLEVKVTQSGSIKAKDAVTIKSQVEGSTTILNIVPEGTMITVEDVENGKVLVELDSSEIEDRLVEEEMEYNNSESTLTEARENLTIQKKDNESNIRQAELDVKFAVMDLKKYLGAEITEEIIDNHKNEPNYRPDFTKLLEDPNRLGGEALKKYRTLSSDIDLAREELSQTDDTLYWTEKLYENDYVTESELKSDQLQLKRQNISVENAEIARELFIKYEFPKQAETLYSDYLDAQHALERTLSQSRSKLAQREATLRSAKARYELQKKRYEKLQQQYKNCTIKAPSPGMVVYGTDRRGRTNIEEGETVREREEIMSLPNASEMIVEVEVPESSINKIQTGQRAKITTDVDPDTTLEGEVSKVSTMPEPEDWLQSGQGRVYATEIKIEESDKVDIRPGMSARAEIFIDRVENALVVPVQCIANQGGKKVCYVKTPDGHKTVKVETGTFNDNFVQIKSGLQEGDPVMLNPPEIITTSRNEQQQGKKLITEEQKQQQQQGQQNEESEEYQRRNRQPGEIQQKERPNNQPNGSSNERQNRRQQGNPNAG
jgi:RND family efflux transporter MFP subunit